jgi:hypothetical protein
MMFDKNPLKTASLLLLSTLMTMVESGDIWYSISLRFRFKLLLSEFRKNFFFLERNTKLTRTICFKHDIELILFEFH